MKNVLIIASLLFVFTNGYALSGNIQAGKTKAAQCAACHGPDGNSANGMWPKLAGQHPAYIIDQLKEFKKGDKGNRNAAAMTAMAAGLSDQDMADLAAFYASQKPKIGEADPKLVKLGQQIYLKGTKASGVPACSACHGPAGKGNSAAKIPALYGQHAQYTVQQLEAYKNKSRSNDMNKMMRTVSSHMTKKEMEAVASYIQGLHD